MNAKYNVFFNRHWEIKILSNNTMSLKNRLAIQFVIVKPDWKVFTMSSEYIVTDKRNNFERLANHLKREAPFKTRSTNDILIAFKF